jgi:hypothetical protein
VLFWKLRQAEQEAYALQYQPLNVRKVRCGAVVSAEVEGQWGDGWRDPLPPLPSPPCDHWDADVAGAMCVS